MLDFQKTCSKLWHTNYQGMGCDHFLRRTHAPRTSRFQCARTRVRTFILWWSHFAPARAPFLLKIKFRGHFYKKKPAENMEALKTFLFKMHRVWNKIFLSFDFLHTQKKFLCMQKKTKKEKIRLFSNKIRKISNFCLKSGQNVWSHVCGVWPAQKWSRAHTSHTCFKSLFARTRTRATAHRTCACAHAPSQPMSWCFVPVSLKKILQIKSRLCPKWPWQSKSQDVNNYRTMKLPEAAQNLKNA